MLKSKLFNPILFLFIVLNTLYVIGMYYYWQENSTSEVNKVDLEKSNLHKYYVMNVRQVYDGTICENGELAAFGLINVSGRDYNLTYIPMETQSSTQKLLKLCYEVNYDYSFEQISQQLNSDDEKNDCHYKGIQFKSPLSDQKCPISDLIFSSLESIEGYEKQSNLYQTKFNLFIKRNDPDKTPLVNLTLVKSSDISFLEQPTEVSFSVSDICQKDYIQYESICSKIKKRNTEFRFVTENQISLDSQCSNGLLSFNNYKFKLRKEEKQWWDAIIVICIPFVIKECIDALRFINKTNHQTRFNILTVLILPLCNLSRQFFLFSEINYLKNSLQDNCYLTEKPLQDMIDGTDIQYIMMIISITISIICLVLFVVIIIYNKVFERRQTSVLINENYRNMDL